MVLQLVVLGFLVAVIANLASGWLVDQAWPFQVVIAALALLWVFWVMGVLARRSLEVRTMLPIIVPFDRERREIVATTNLDDWMVNDWAARSLVWGGGIMAAHTAVNKLATDDLLPQGGGGALGLDDSWAPILDSLQYAILEFMARNYSHGWAIIDEASIHGMTTSGRAHAPATKIRFEDLPQTIRESRVFHGVNSNERGIYTGVRPTSFVLPRGMRVEHETVEDSDAFGEYRKLFFVSPRTRVMLHVAPSSWVVMGNAEQQNRFSAYYPRVTAIVTSSIWRAMGRRAAQERHWADDMIARLGKYFSLER